ncbi:MAG: ChbG/HpnK family deacetylase [Variovorax sp.]
MKALRYLCICADDFGLSEGINGAVMDLAARGRISATGCMVRRHHWTSGARELRQLDPAKIDVGLHLDLDFPALRGGHEGRLVPLIAASYFGKLNAGRVRLEIQEQLDLFEQSMDRAPAFVDGHRHVHQLPVVREMLIEELSQRYRSAPPWLRNTACNTRGARLPDKAGLVHLFGGAAFAELASRHGLPLSRNLLGVYPFSADDIGYGRYLATWLAAFQTGDVLMCHPSLGDFPEVPHGAARMREYQVLRNCVALHGGAGKFDIAPLSAHLLSAAEGCKFPW